MPKFRKKPIIVDAKQWNTINALEIVKWSDGHVQPHIAYEGNTAVETNYLAVATLEGTMLADKGDWIIKGVNGEFYPCKPDIFVKTYELVED